MLKKPNPFKAKQELAKAKAAEPEAAKGNVIDLTTAPPRSPFEMLNGYVFLPRLIDKARAHLGETLGSYTFGKPGSLDAFFFTQHGLSPEEFAKAVRAAGSDQEIVTWFSMRTKIKTPNAIKEYNRKFASLAPSSAESVKAFMVRVKQVVPPEHADRIKTWFQLLDADEGRLDLILK
jgi:hypothetical protein